MTTIDIPLHNGNILHVTDNETAWITKGALVIRDNARYHAIIRVYCKRAARSDRAPLIDRLCAAGVDRAFAAHGIVGLAFSPSNVYP